VSNGQNLVRPNLPPQSAPVSSDAVAMMRFQANQKSILISYLLWFFFGGLGGHRYYNGRIGSGLAQLALLVLGLLAELVGIATIAMQNNFVASVGGALLLLIAGLWFLIDAFLIPGWVRGHNDLLARKLSVG
jgi:TM2 domain-containing membrane protein YozV